jgi:ribonuclease J
MKIIVHRGAEELGGICIEVRTKQARVLLDYGAPLSKTDPVTHKSVPPTVKETILDIPGLYGESELPISAIIISHAHQAHYGALFAKPINPGIKVYMTEVMEDMIRITAKMPRDARKLSAGVEYYRKGHRFVLGNIGITPFLMDHSASESFGFFIETEGKKIIYTGDFREHGSKAAAFRQFLAADMGQVDVLITEGTQADVEKGPSEPDTMGHIEALVGDKNGTLYVICSGQNMDLIAHLAQLAKNTRRLLVVDGYVALLLERLRILARKQGVELKLPGLHTEYLRVVDNNATKRIAELPEYAETYKRMRARMLGWDAVRHSLSRLIIPVRANAQHWVGQHIKDFSGAALLYSAWESCREEDGLPETLEYFKSRGLADIPMQTTGHAYFSTIRKLVENKRPLNIIPVQTEHPEKFVKAFGKRVRLLKDGEEFFLY